MCCGAASLVHKATHKNRKKIPQAAVRTPLWRSEAPPGLLKKESLILPCCSWKTQPPPAHWSMTYTQEVGLYRFCQWVEQGGSLRCTLLPSLPWLLVYGAEASSLRPDHREVRHAVQQGQGSGLPLE